MAERFWPKVDKSEDCWNWVGAKSVQGYGLFVHDNKKHLLAHRVVFELHDIEIPDGLVVDHICRNHACVRMSHLRLVNSKQNSENRSRDGQRTSTASGVRGVTWSAKRKVWRARVTHEYREYTAGTFPTIEEAEAAAITLRNKLHTHNDADRAVTTST
jgi:hypothetical protein